MKAGNMFTTAQI